MKHFSGMPCIMFYEGYLCLLHRLFVATDTFETFDSHKDLELVVLFAYSCTWGSKQKC